MGGFHDINDNRQELFETRKSKPTDGMPRDWNWMELGRLAARDFRETPKAGISIVDHEIITLLRSFGTLKRKCLTKDWGEKRGRYLWLGAYERFSIIRIFKSALTMGPKIWPLDVFVP